MPWRPLSKRAQADARLDEPHEGLPAHIAGPALDWLANRFQPAGLVDDEALTDLQLRFRLDPPLDRRDRLGDLIARCRDDDDFALDVIDYSLYHLDRLGHEYEFLPERAKQLAKILILGGSAWIVAPIEDEDDGVYRLARRSVGPVPDAVAALSPAARAHAHLVEAWNRSTGRNPDPSGAYREAVRAVEAAAKPVVLPASNRATLGTMIAALRDKPEKWATRMGEVHDVRRQMELLWTNQLDRHGTDDESVPLEVSQEEAELAVHMALLLTRIFARGDIWPAE